MVKIARPQIPDQPPRSVTIGQQKFNRGVISVVDSSDIPKTALAEADNIFLYEDGVPGPRPGIGWYGTDLGHNLDGFADHDMDDETIHLLVVANGTVYRSTNDGATWDACSGGSLTAGKKCHFEQFNSYTLITNSHDYPVRYDGTTTLVPYTPIDTPTGVSVTPTGFAGTPKPYTYRYRVSALNEVGYSIASAAVTANVDITRDSWNDSNYETLTWGAVSGATSYDIFVGLTPGAEQYIASVENATTYVDKGQAIEQSLLAPESNTTSGPRIGDATMVGTRLYGVADRDNPARTWISGPSRLAGQFGSANDATYLDWQEGGKFRPVKVMDYRDGKGTPLATIYCKSKNGLGCVLQGSLELFTVGDQTFPVPNFYRLPGSRGTDAPFGVIEVLNDHMYPNSQAFFNLGSRAQYLNLLSTDEVSSNIRPDVLKITENQSHKIAAHYQDGIAYFSMPISGSTDNNVTAIYDTEREAWIPRAFNVGFERFLTHTDADGKRHLLCYKPGDTQLSEISTSIKGDYGAAFPTTLRTGRMQVDPRDRINGWIWCDDAEVEFSQPVGTITVELSTRVKEEGFGVAATQDINPSSDTYSWDAFAWDTREWDDTSTLVSAYSEPSVKRFFEISQDINEFQFTVTTNEVLASYRLRTLQVSGTASQSGKDRNWELI